MIMESIKLYQDREDVTLKAYIWEDSPELLNGRTRPAVVICPGGGYMSCSDREGEPVALRFAGHGIPCICFAVFCLYGGKGRIPGYDKAASGKAFLQIPNADA